MYEAAICDDFNHYMGTVDKPVEAKKKVPPFFFSPGSSNNGLVDINFVVLIGPTDSDNAILGNVEVLSACL